MAEFQEYILLPERGLRVRPEDSPLTAKFLDSLAGARSTATPLELSLPTEVARPTPLRVVDSMREDGPKLVELTKDNARALRRSQPGVRLEPVRYYDFAVSGPFRPTPPAAASSGPAIRLKVEAAGSGSPVQAAQVEAFTDFQHRIGAAGATDAAGEIELALGAAQVTLDRLYVRPPAFGFWGAYRANRSLASGDTVTVDRLDLSGRDICRLIYGACQPGEDGAGVRVGVIDGGVSHTDVAVVYGQNTVRGEPRDDWGDNGLGHGTHVAGIIASRGAPPAGLSGLAPEVELYCYRVAGKGDHQATNYAIVKALIYAVGAGCHLINLSLGHQATDEVLREAIEDARDEGVLVIAAAGNDDRGPVRVPGRYPGAVAVSAMGRQGTFPQGALEEADVAAPFGNDPDDFLAAFTNVGDEIDLCAPGVGIVSTVPGGYASRSGTSMACPVVTGVASRLLSADHGLLHMPSNRARSDAIARRLFHKARLLGFGYENEGFGLVGL